MLGIPLWRVRDQIQKRLPFIAARRIAAYQKRLAPGAPLKVVFGGHWSDHLGWLLLRESDQDITRRLKFRDNSVDVIFTEHVLEHIPMAPTMGFFRESLRVLKPGGVLRVVCPMLEPMIAFDPSTPVARSYFKSGVEPMFPREKEALAALGLQDPARFARMFFFNTLFLRHGHAWIWSAEAMRDVLRAVGFGQVTIRPVGDGVDPENAIERRNRGTYGGFDWREDRKSGSFDPESGVVEAIK